MTLSVFVLSCLLILNAQGAPTKGRLWWLRCRPGLAEANCLEENGPLIDIPETRSGHGKIENSESSLHLDPKDELSGDGSGESQLFDFLGAGGQLAEKQRVLGVPSPIEGSAELDEGSGMGKEEKELKKNLPAEKELEEDGFIL